MARAEFITVAGPGPKPDAVLGITAAVKAARERHSDKRIYDLGVGVFAVNGETYVPPSVLEAKARVRKKEEVAAARAKAASVGRDYYVTPVYPDPNYPSPAGEEEYLGIREFLEGSARLVFGAEYADTLLREKSFALAGTVGGTSAVRVMLEATRATDKKKDKDKRTTVLIGTPTWPNHLDMAEDIEGVDLLTYKHMKDNKFDMQALLKAIKDAPDDTVVLFHAGKTHNPTGVNPRTAEEWIEIAKAMEGKRAYFDAPYVGFGDGFEKDVECIKIFREANIPVSVGVSYSKNAGLYGERVGALLMPLATPENALKVQRELNKAARKLYSSPPSYGERVMIEIFSDPALFALWREDNEKMAKELEKRRAAFALASGFSFVEQQTGMFSILPLTADDVDKLAERYYIFMLKSGRINFGGMDLEDAPYIAQSIRAVIEERASQAS